MIILGFVLFTIGWLLAMFCPTRKTYLIWIELGLILSGLALVMWAPVV